LRQERWYLRSQSKIKKKHPSLSCDEMNPADVPYNTSPKSYTPHTHTMRTDHP
jgi:hypothetical protein